MASFQIVDNQSSAARLADLLNGTQRRRPVVVVTTPAGRPEPWIDVADIARHAGDLVEVYLMRTGDCSWEFSRLMADGTQVYGGAGRVYPVGHSWASDLRRSPLRFAFSKAEGERATDELVSDAFRMAVAAGLVKTQPTNTLRHVTGVVKQLIAKRAVVDVGNSQLAAIPEELTVEDVPIAHLFTVGQRIKGWLDPETNRIDVTKSLRSGTLRHCWPGDRRGSSRKWTNPTSKSRNRFLDPFVPTRRQWSRQSSMNRCSKSQQPLHPLDPAQRSLTGIDTEYPQARGPRPLPPHRLRRRTRRRHCC